MCAEKEIEITPEMIKRAARELGYWLEFEGHNTEIAERILRAAFGKPNPLRDSV
jgi:hypothetical protein